MVPDHERYGGVPRGSLSPVGSLPDSWGPIGPMNKKTGAPPSSALPQAARSPLAGWWGTQNGPWGSLAARIAKNGGIFLQGSGGMTERAPKRLMAAYLTWRGITLPHSLVPVARCTRQPLSPPPQPGTYRNPAVARMTAGAARHNNSSTSTRRVATITTQTRLRIPATTRATSVHAPAPSGTSVPRSLTTSTSSSHPPPALTRPCTHHNGRRPPTPQGLRSLRHHRGPARHKAPDKNVQPKGRHNDTHLSTTRPEQSGSTTHHLLGGEACLATRIRQQQGPGTSNPSAPCAHKRAQARSPPATWVHNPKRHPTRAHAANG